MKNFCMKSAAGLLLFFVFQNTAQAEPDGYLKGYVDALLEQHAELKPLHIQATAVDAKGAVELDAAGCLNENQKQIVQNALRKSHLAPEIKWKSVEGCAANQTGVIDVAKADEVTVVKTEALPRRELFAPLIADVREPRSSLRYENYKTSKGSEDIGAISAGDRLPIYNWELKDGQTVQLGLEGGVFALFSFSKQSKDLINADYILGLPITYRKDAFSARFRLYHQSSHLGDEFLIANPDVPRVNLSYEDTQLLLAYEIGEFRLIAGGGRIVHSEPDLEPWHTEAGVEYRHRHFIKDLDLVGGALIGWSEEQNWTGNQSYQLGLAIHKFGDRELRLMTEYYTGFSPNGQFFEERIHYYGIGLAIDL